MNLKTFIIIMLVMLASCLKDDDLKLNNIQFEPQVQNDGWEIEAASSEKFNMDILNDVFKSIYSEDNFILIHSLLIVKDGQLAVECYTRTLDDRNTPHHLWSTTKSFVSMATGIAIDKGFIRSVTDTVFRYIPEYLPFAHPELRSLSIGQCLTMNSGIDYSNDGQEEDEVLCSVPEDLTLYMIQRPMRYAPGEYADYKNSDPQILVKVVSNAADMDFIEFSKAHLFDPLGITNYYWSRNKKDNTPFGGFGLWMVPRDLAKVGKMLLDKGKWNGRQVISEQWIDDATTGHTQINGFDYGYLFWVDPQKNYFWTWGAGGQFVFVIPDKDIVVVITSEQFADNQNTTIEEATDLVDKIIESVLVL